ncbi:MAG: patatin-like phospholipase family protein [Alphaproteobacteria bacterium]|nr:patatin-like phospholipase family protein [Alphaproteobacteria bacterium]
MPKNRELSNDHIRYPVGLALGSGMARGFAHIGALKALHRNGIRPSLVAGTSIGALVGGCYLAGKLDTLEDWALSLDRRKVFSYLDFRVRSAGMIGGHRLARLLGEYFGGMKIEDLPHPFIAIAADLATGHEVWLRKGDFINALRASFALPGVFPPVEINDQFLVDGALVNPVPVSACQRMGARMTIAVDLNADMIGKSVHPGERYQTIAGFDILPHKKQGVMGRVFGRNPNNPSLFGVMVSALNILQDRVTRARLAGDPPDIHIKPQIGHIGAMEFERGVEMIAAGEEAVEAAMPEIRAAMAVLLRKD